MAPVLCIVQMALEGLIWGELPKVGDRGAADIVALSRKAWVSPPLRFSKISRAEVS